LILDLMHLFAKLWKAAYVFHAEGSLEAETFGSSTNLCLFGEVGQVVKGIRQSITRRGLSGPQNPERVRQTASIPTAPECCNTTWPAVGRLPVERACKNRIKDRRKRSGMRWSEQLAKTLVQLRAIYLSPDFDPYW
jgi:hypothetical protein